MRVSVGVLRKFLQLIMDTLVNCSCSYSSLCSLVELQVFLFELIANFEFGITEEAKRVRRENALVMLPMIEGLEDDHVVPLKVSLVE